MTVPNDHPTPSDPNDLADLAHRLRLPGTDLATRALGHVHGIAAPAIFTHSVRTYLYGRALAQRQGLAPEVDYDSEVLFLSCVLHDVGLTDAGDGDQPFHLDGADRAVEYLTDAGLTDDRADVVWDAIALHLDPLVAGRKRPEIALVSAGAGLDLGATTMPGIDLDLISDLLPRHELAAVIKRTVLDQAARKPQKAPPFTLPGELVRQATGQQWPTWEEMAR